MYRIRRCLVWLTVFFMSWCSLADAQVIPISENATLSIKIAGTEPTRIAVDGDRISVLRGLAGAYTYSNDNNGGAVFLKPTEAYQNKPFYLFVSTEQGHNYILQLHPTKTRSASMLILKPRLQVEDQMKAGSLYTDALTTLMENMVNERASENYEVIHVKNTKTLTMGAQLKLQLKTLYSGSRLKGEIYEVTNISNRTVPLTERIFYQQGDRAIALKDQALFSGGKTFLYRITSHG